VCLKILDPEVDLRLFLIDPRAPKQYLFLVQRLLQVRGELFQ
jgi:hypothetical protein